MRGEGEGWESRLGWKEGIGQLGFDNLGLSDMGVSGGVEERVLIQGYKGLVMDLKLFKYVL